MKKILLLFVLLWVHFTLAQVCPSAHITDSYGSDEVFIDCNYDFIDKHCIELEVDYTTIGSTEDYSVESINFKPEIPFNSGNPLVSSLASGNKYADDKFSDVIPLGFDFCFYDQVFSDIVIGTNGIMTFNKKAALSENPSAIAGMNPDPSLLGNAIFAVQQDLIFDTSDDSEIYYTTIGEAPCRKFVINYYKGNTFQCESRSTIQIVLHETSNDIDVHILQKPISCDNGRDIKSLLGIMNKDGSLGVSPEYRNTGIWQANKESWKFKPIGTQEPSVTWKDESGKTIGNGKKISVCPEKNAMYKAEVAYGNCMGNSFVVSDSIIVNYSAKYPILEANNFNVCDQYSDGEENIILKNYNSSIASNDINDYNFSYYKKEIDAENQTNEIQDITLSGTQTVYVRINNINEPNCFIIEPIAFKFVGIDIAQSKIIICDTENDNEELDVVLKPHINKILKNLQHKSYTIYGSENDAINKVNAITKANLNKGTSLWLNIKVFEGCEKTLGPIGVKFLETPRIRPTSTITSNICDTNWNGAEPYGWDLAVRSVMNIEEDESFSVHTSYSQAMSGANKQSVISSSKELYYVRITNPKGCYTIIEQPVDFNFRGVSASDVEDYICFNGVEDIAIDLKDYLEEMNYTVEGYSSPKPKVEISFYDNEDSAKNNLSDDLKPNQIIKENGHIVEKNYYVRFQLPDGCYSIRKININLIYPSPQNNPVIVCDIFNDRIENNTLSIYDKAILGNQKGTVKYFLNKNDADNDINEISIYEFQDVSNLFVTIKSHGCLEIHEVTFQMTEVPTVNNLDIQLGEICDSNNDGKADINLTALNKQVYDGKATYKYFLTYNENTKELGDPISNPRNYPVSRDFDFYVKVDAANIYCNAIAKIHVTFNNDAPFQIENEDLYQCDFEGDFNEIFNLDEVRDKYIETLSENFLPFYFDISLHRTENDALTHKNPILENPFNPNSTEYVVYVRAHHKISGCLDIKKLILHTNTPPKPISIDQIICDTNFDGRLDITLPSINEKVLLDPNGFIFTYYYTQQDALDRVNMIDDSIPLEFKTVPEKLWVRVERENLMYCFDIQDVYLLQGENFSEQPNNKVVIQACDLDANGIAIMDLTVMENEISGKGYTFKYYNNLEEIMSRKSPIVNPTEYENVNPYQEKVYVVVEKEGLCPIYFSATIKYNTIKVNIDDILICPGESVSIIPKIQDDVSKYLFQWLDEKGNVISENAVLENVTEKQKLILNVTSKDFLECQTNFPVQVSFYDIPTITAIKEENNTVTIEAVGLYPIEYSLDGVNWQSSNIFRNVEPNVYMIYARYVDKECNGDTQEFVVLFLQSVITPNGDGFNDVFLIEHLDTFGEELSSVVIFDRYGKEIFSDEDNVKIEWDGTSLGNKVSTSDYWYIIKLPDGRQKSGHITVKNQNSK